MAARVLHVPVVDLAVERGRLWSRQPQPQPSGLVAVFRSHVADEGRGAGDGLYQQITVSSFAPDGQSMSMLDYGGRLFHIRLAQNRFAVATRDGFAGTVLEFAPRKRHEVCVVMKNNGVRSVNLETQATVCNIKGHRRMVSNVSFHPSGSTCISCSADMILLWDTHTWSRQRALAAEEAGFVMAKFCPTGNKIIAALENGQFFVWMFKSFDLSCSFAVPDDNAHIDGFAVSRCGRYVCAGGRADSVYLWDLGSGKQNERVRMRVLKLPMGITSVLQMEFVFNSTVLCLLCSDHQLRFIEWQEHSQIFTIPTKVGVVSFSVDQHSRYLNAVMDDGSSNLYDLVVARRANENVGTAMADVDINEANTVGEHMNKLSWASGRPKPVVDNWTKSHFELKNNDRRSHNESQKRSYGSSGHINFKVPQRHGRSGEDASETFAPLYQIAKLNKESKDLNIRKLKKLLATYGEYPAEYRLLIWRFVLCLPENHESFRAFEARGTHTAYQELFKQYPLQSRKLYKALVAQLSALTHWAPIVGELPYAAGLFFPFVKLFTESPDGDKLSCFEVLASFMMNWCRGWFEFYPNPPVSLLVEVEKMVEHHDLDLVRHLHSLGVYSQTFVWEPLRTAFTQVYTRAEWLKLFDHVFSNDPSFLLYVAVAHLLYFRSTILALENAVAADTFFRSSNAVSINKIIGMAYELMRTTPDQLRPESCVDFEPLSSPTYPVFSNYPKFVVDYQIKERERIRQEEEDYLRKRELMVELRKKNEALALESRKWKDQQREMEELENSRRLELFKEEERRAQEKIKIDQMHKEQRLKQISNMEENARAFIEQQKAVREAELRRIEEELEVKRKLEQYEVQSRMEEEALLSLEAQARERVREVEMQKERERQAQRIRDEAMAKQRKLEMQEKAQLDQWRLEDEERKIKEEQERKRAEQVAQLEEELRLKQELEDKFLNEEMSRSQKIAQIAQERRLRRLKEERVVKTTKDMKEKERLAELKSRQEQMEIRAMLNEERTWKDKKAQERELLLETERRKMAMELEQRAERLRELERLQKRREFEEAQLERKRAEEQEVIKEEKELQKIILKMDEEKKLDRKMEADVIAKEKELREKVAFQRMLQEAEERVIQEERANFNRLRDELRAKAALEEAESIRQHEDYLRRVSVMRENELMSVEGDIRKRVQKDELARLHSEAAHYDKQRDDRMKHYRKEEEKLRTAMEKNIKTRTKELAAKSPLVSKLKKASATSPKPTTPKAAAKGTESALKELEKHLAQGTRGVRSPRQSRGSSSSPGPSRQRTSSKSPPRRPLLEDPIEAISEGGGMSSGPATTMVDTLNILEQPMVSVPTTVTANPAQPAPRNPPSSSVVSSLTGLTAMPTGTTATTSVDTSITLDSTTDDGMSGGKSPQKRTAGSKRYVDSLKEKAKKIIEKHRQTRSALAGILQGSDSELSGGEGGVHSLGNGSSGSSYRSSGGSGPMMSYGGSSDGSRAPSPLPQAESDDI